MSPKKRVSKSQCNFPFTQAKQTPHLQSSTKNSADQWLKGMPSWHSVHLLPFLVWLYVAGTNLAGSRRRISTAKQECLRRRQCQFFLPWRARYLPGLLGMLVHVNIQSAIWARRAVGPTENRVSYVYMYCCHFVVQTVQESEYTVILCGVQLVS